MQAIQHRSKKLINQTSHPKDFFEQKKSRNEQAKHFLENAPTTTDSERCNYYNNMNTLDEPLSKQPHPRTTDE